MKKRNPDIPLFYGISGLFVTFKVTHIQLVEAMHAPHFLLIFKISEVRHLDVSAFFWGASEALLCRHSKRADTGLFCVNLNNDLPGIIVIQVNGIDLLFRILERCINSYFDQIMLKEVFPAEVFRAFYI